MSLRKKDSFVLLCSHGSRAPAHSENLENLRKKINKDLKLKVASCYLEKNEPALGTSDYIEWQQKMEEIHGQADLLIAKQRHGPTGNIKLSFERKYTRFGNFISKSESDSYE